MSSDASIIVGHAIELDYSKYHEKIYDEYDDFLDKYSGKEVYFLADGMNGDYLYILCPQMSVDIEDMYGCVNHTIVGLSAENRREIKRLYKEVTGNECTDSDIKLIVFNHCT